MPYMQPRSDSVMLDANGDGAVNFSIDGRAQRWVLDGGGCITDQAAGSMPVPRCDVYQGSVAPGNWRGGTDNGQRDQFSGTVVLYPDDVLIFQFTGGVPGSTATAIITGSFDPPGSPLSD